MEELTSPVLAAVVTYNAQAHIQDCLTALRGAGSWPVPVYVVDNASTDQTRDLIQGMAIPELALDELPENRGVAAAFNLILGQAERIGARWVLLLDQDSRCHPQCLDILFEHAEALLQAGNNVGALCPTVYSRKFPQIVHMPYIWDGRYLQHVELGPEHDTVRVDSGISSGTLYSVQALLDVGGFREDYFIDFVDHECHLRLANAGWEMWWIRKAFLEHELGTWQKMTPEGLWIEHQPFRYYYIVRNMLHGRKLHGGYLSMLSFLNELRKHVSKMRRYGQAPNTCIFYMLKGIVHATRSRFGPLA